MNPSPLPSVFYKAIPAKCSTSHARSVSVDDLKENHLMSVGSILFFLLPPPPSTSSSSSSSVCFDSGCVWNRHHLIPPLLLLPPIPYPPLLSTLFVLLRLLSFSFHLCHSSFITMWLLGCPSCSPVSLPLVKERMRLEREEATRLLEEETEVRPSSSMHGSPPSPPPPDETLALGLADQL